MKRFLSFIVFTGLSFCAFGLDISKIKSEIEKNPVFKDAQYSLYAKYVGGASILEINPDLRLTPASILKLYTTAAALDILGPAHRFQTEIYTSGVLKRGRLYGNILIKGGGDPTLGSLRMADTPSLDELMGQWVEAVKEQGIERIEGGIYADNSVFSGIMLPWRTSYQNIGNYFAAPNDGLTIRDNSYEIYFEPSSQDGALAKVLRADPEIKGLEIKSFVHTYDDVSGDYAYVNFVPGSTHAEIYGSIPTSERSLEISAAMPSPALFAAQYLLARLEEAGIKVKGDASVHAPLNYDGKKLILTHESPTVADIVKYTNKRSFNLYAGMLLMAISAHTGGEGTSSDGILKVRDYLTRLEIDAGNYEVFDGSGLTRDNITTCRTTVDLLEAVLRQPYSDVFLDSLPVVGDPGDMGNMARRLRGTTAAYNSRVKTGSLDRARAHAGYTKDINGKDIVFCIITNNFKGYIKEVNEVHEMIINSLSDIGANKKPVVKKTVKEPAPPKPASAENMIIVE
jgi:D-alanyl-D-alanine carboxypeptidase/D-alanyl-D-alanine-endopeptidase (penicillin-binding protein 4)